MQWLLQGYKRRAKRVVELCQFGYRTHFDDFAIGIESAYDPLFGCHLVSFCSLPCPVLVLRPFW